MFLIIAYSNAQSKKEQIIDLNYKIDSLTLITQSNKEKIISLNSKIDSLNVVLSTTRDNTSKEISLNNEKIKELSNSLGVLTNDLLKCQSSGDKLTKENNKFKTDLIELSTKKIELEAKLKAIQVESSGSEVKLFCVQTTDDDEGGYAGNIVGVIKGNKTIVLERGISGSCKILTERERVDFGVPENSITSFNILECCSQVYYLIKSGDKYYVYKGGQGESEEGEIRNWEKIGVY
jgi:hypothetical protein